jgi:hypothetical protein
VTRRVAADFLRRLIEAVPYRVHNVLTDNGTHFSDPTADVGPVRLWDAAARCALLTPIGPFRLR